MPSRKYPLITQGFYHVYNKGVDGRVTFCDKREYLRMVALLNYYRFDSLPLSFSHFLRLTKLQQNSIVSSLIKRSEKKVKILSYCLMPTHFHLLLQQIRDGGISEFLSCLLNGYTKYFNTKHDRPGHLFLGQFKASVIESENMLVHVSRYIHLNPYTSYLVKTFEELLAYKWSSLPEYLSSNQTEDAICDKEDVSGNFATPNGYRQFLFDQKDYQRKLKALKDLVFERPLNQPRRLVSPKRAPLGVET